ncbi:ubiquitin C-terminal hydrolase family protein [Massariosphaeria phaeospora]|uniref:ubiquitinyl hydrolase 1 n=1 Tax=Massariosphaeria phaeospora TaxID=100035 RepID=A0A7C8M2W0_9PLEO|nr:ubiquitin C-terminal hydrolase family protein [Massariosphaeria phaeospora]
MNGVSRFLSRRDKHPEKRQSKHARSKVRSSHSPSPHSSSPRYCSSIYAADPCDHDSRLRPRGNSLQTLYHKLPSMLQSPSQGILDLFLRKQPPCADVTALHVEVSTSKSSDHLTLQSRQTSTDLYAVLSRDRVKITDKDDKKVKALVQRLHDAGITSLGEAQAGYALLWYPDDLDQAYHLLLLAKDSFDGILKDYNPNVTMLGAINRNMVTCYLDALLFAMFARLDSFEGMLFDNLEDEPKKKLAAILRLWVNLLRTGRLIRVDLTKHLQDTLAKCGWEEAAEVCQQDASEAFTFITGALELPLLTLKMDIYHTGREDEEDDHKFVNERLLEVCIPEVESDKVVSLEDCLETYFNNRIEVKRYLQRQNTRSSINSTEKGTGKAQAIHIETHELSGAESPLMTTPTSLAPSTSATPVSPTISIRPLAGRRRADSIFTERYAKHGKLEEKKFDEKKLLEEMLSSSSEGRPRAGSLRKEVLMPAWQFFSLIPWYTANMPKTDAQVAAHFSSKRPVLGICLKRYSFLPSGEPSRMNVVVDIPLEIGLPHFISDDRVVEEGPLFGNFKLVLQSVVCHRGVSVDSGHYISLVRANPPHSEDRPASSHSGANDRSNTWLHFDDLATPRVTEVDITQALREESPYLLFYQVQPIDEELASRGDPPSYAEAQSNLPTADPSKETLASFADASGTDAEAGGEWDRMSSVDMQLDSANSDEPGGRSSMSSNRRSSVAFEEVDSSVQNMTRGRAAPVTPDEPKAGFLSASRRNSRTWMPGSKSRPSSQSGENRISFTLSRLTGRASKDKLQITDSGTVEDRVIVVNEVQNGANTQQGGSVVNHQKESGLGRSKSKREKKEEKKRMRSKSQDPGGVATIKGKEKSRPDRECAVM